MTKVAPVTLSQLLQALPGGSSGPAGVRVRKAHEFARQAHGDRRRESHELYVEHDLAVAHIICELGMDTGSIVAGLLHDILLPHTNQNEETVRREFGPEIASLVGGLSKLTPYTEKHGADRDDRVLEAIRQALLTIIEGDARVILIHLVDSLQDLRKAGDLGLEKRKQIAREARDIYAPLANRLGVWSLKWELEDLAFRYLEPDQYRLIASQIAERRAERNRRISEAAKKLERKLNEYGLEAEVTGRPKHMYSIYRKMQSKGVDFDHIYDIRALRVILEKDDPNLCYQALGIVHNLWQPIPQEFDDYIARSKSNGYQSLHTAVIDENGQTLEVQIRTRKMHEEAERGIASHWAYKEGGRHSAELAQRINALRQLLNSVREADGIPVDEEIFKNEVLGERIYVFTPRGDVVELPAGSTPIDFAYAIHTEVGHRCRGARVNGKMVSLDYKLKSGEKIDIITASRGGPSRDWMNESLGYTGSARTRSKIRAWFRQQEREKNIQQGREVVNRELKRLGVADVYTVEDIAEALRYNDVEQFLAKVGFGDIQSTQIGGAIAALQQKLRPDDELRPLLQTQPGQKRLTVRGLSGLHTKMARCCNPIPPEPIMGYITRGRGVTIHRKDCLQLLATNEPERWIEVEWGMEQETYPIPIVVKAYRRPGLMEDIANILKGEHVNLSATKTTTANSITNVYLLVEVSSLDQLNWILRKFEKLNNVIEARRQRWAD
ncbi:MAG: bifunctional (p)ppGpp synthetase/guanosine-3',5'-bis(diphosphate) 3'-pyrophosphohydrolase [Chloroflexi bacterium]|nr:bifunctional (p)ppGpp synthetase/guanosine-3',5'-bis(diphosphate) 3'-pyrophosphohydrolase [Chloroflexota bacterium]MCI0578254.1 bifunctional (p)ppGpp synthetase/guanosine-3',5'-bis(diphosphate) 3'-pyrophosphohydrolase [Chloroflexota bacterium]MCI0643499.1 bifunctional (p)ppGpp synthetase/guanosine-3',5'-bis(diphosphate) 3'-pyrophosphohydrolase [Chloroflexota bacterium]MCI0726607.1 bifunctional (p)ppGpp synthetase/guanosine-3',5'-bis(diphosphate) 3'-pyrophosphohydrolase [Chloroflexota bacteriu